MPWTSVNSFSFFLGNSFSGGWGVGVCYIFRSAFKSTNHCADFEDYCLQQRGSIFDNHLFPSWFLFTGTGYIHVNWKFLQQNENTAKTYTILGKYLVWHIMCACMHACVCVCVYVCVCSRTGTCVHTQMEHAWMCVHVCIQACMHVHVCACMHAYMGGCVRVDMCAVVYIWARTLSINNPVAISTKLQNNQHSLTHNYEFSPHLLWLFLQQIGSDDQSLNFTCSLIDLCDASVAIIPLSWHVIHVAHPTKDLDRLQVHRKLQYSKRELKEINSIANSSSWDWI